jgi:hypothetical protein
MTELNGVDSDEERTVAIIKIVLKLVKWNWHVLMTMTTTTDKPVLSSERDPTLTKWQLPDSNKNLVLGPRKGLAPRLTDRLTVCLA